MNWEMFYLICFAAGFMFSVLSFLGGAFHLHVPKFLHLGGHSLGHAPLGAGHGHAPVGAGHSQGGTPKATVKSSTHGQHFSFFNPLTSAAFLTWFGGTGYLLVHLRHIWVFAGLALSSAAGLAGASIVFWFVGKVLMADERELDPLDFEMTGVLGYVSSSVRSGGTGEIIFTQQGVRKTCAARCETGESLPRGMEVIVTRYDRGVAYIRPWDELAGPAETITKHEQITE